MHCYDGIWRNLKNKSQKRTKNDAPAGGGESHGAVEGDAVNALTPRAIDAQPHRF